MQCALILERERLRDRDLRESETLAEKEKERWFVVGLRFDDG